MWLERQGKIGKTKGKRHADGQSRQSRTWPNRGVESVEAWGRRRKIEKGEEEQSLASCGRAEPNLAIEARSERRGGAGGRSREGRGIEILPCGRAERTIAVLGEGLVD